MKRYSPNSRIASPHALAGMTLVEAVTVTAIIALVGTALLGMIQHFYRSNAYLLEQTTATENARRGLAYTLQNIREASYGDDGSYPITNAATSTITFHADTDQDGSIERVRVYLAGGTLYRATTNSAGNPATYSGQTEQVLNITPDIRNGTSTPIFRYFDASGAELAGSVDITDIASVSVQVDIDLNPTRAPNVFTLTGGATLRNLLTE